MRAISGSIVLLAGAVMFAAGALCGHADTQNFANVVGGILVIAGDSVWYAGIRHEDR